jgi:hypothetical protein
MAIGLVEVESPDGCAEPRQSAEAASTIFGREPTNKISRDFLRGACAFRENRFLDGRRAMNNVSKALCVDRWSVILPYGG